MLKCLGDIEGNRFLDGRTAAAAVGLAPVITPPFSGARWAAEEIAPGAISLECLGEINGAQFLDEHTLSKYLFTRQKDGSTPWKELHITELKD